MGTYSGISETFRTDSGPSLLLSHMYFLKTEILPHYHLVLNRILGRLENLYTRDKKSIVNQYEVLSTSFIIISVTAIDCAK